MIPERERTDRDDIAVPLLLAGLAAAATEAAVVAVSAVRVGGGPGAFIIGFAEGAATILATLTVPLVALGWILGTRSVRRLGKAFRAGFGGGEPGSPALALWIVLGLLALSVFASFWVGILLKQKITERFAAIGQALTLTATLGLASLAGSMLATGVSALFRRPGISRLRRLAFLDPGAGVLLLAGAAAVALLQILPGEFAPTPVMAFVGLGAGLLPFVQRPVARVMGGRRVVILAAVLLLASLGLLSMVNSVPATVRMALLLRAPYSGTLLNLGQRLADGDGDGFSPILLGGDCNDRDARINPDAIDIPGNGLDENCSGADSTAYRAPDVRQYDRPRAIPAKPNIAVILVDALRTDHTGFAGYPRQTTPFIDAFSKRAIWFERAYTPAPVTSSAILSLFTGNDFRQAPRRYKRAKRYTVRSETETVAEILHASGYDTIGFTTDYVQRYIQGIGQGFNVWRLAGPRAGRDGSLPGSANFNTDDAIAYLKKAPQDGSRPFFLFLHYIEPHASYNLHRPWDFGERSIDLYDSEIAFCDHEVGRLISAIDSRKDASGTAVFVVSDHGEMFGDHGLKHHGRSLYEADVRVVLLARIPEARKRTVASPVLLTDLTPTILDLAGVKRRSLGQGRSLLPYVFHNHEELQRPLFLFTELKQGAVQYNASAVIRWPLKYIRDRRTGVQELFDLSRDPLEEKSLVDRLPRELGGLSDLLDSFEAFVNGNESPNRTAPALAH